MNGQSLFLFLLLLSSCATSKDYIIDTSTTEKLVGFTSDCKYQIGKTNKNEISMLYSNQQGTDTTQLYLCFIDAAKNQESLTLLSGVFGIDRFKTSKGLTIGDSREKVIRLYGKPIATELVFWEDKQHRIALRIKGLFYKNLAVVFEDDNTERIRAISLGWQFPTDKKYRRAN